MLCNNAYFAVRDASAGGVLSYLAPILSTFFSLVVSPADNRFLIFRQLDQNVLQKFPMLEMVQEYFFLLLAWTKRRQGQAGLSTVVVAHLLAVDWLGWLC